MVGDYLLVSEKLGKNIEKISFVDWGIQYKGDMARIYEWKSIQDEISFSEDLKNYLSKMMSYYHIQHKAFTLLQNNDIQLPLLSLLFVFIDQLSWFRVSGISGKTDYLFVLEKYIVPHLTTDVTADELYSARNGLIHTHSPNSRDVLNNNIRKVLYYSGSQTFDEMCSDHDDIKYEIYAWINISELLKIVFFNYQKYITDLVLEGKMYDVLSKLSSIYLPRE